MTRSRRFLLDFHSQSLGFIMIYLHIHNMTGY